MSDERDLQRARADDPRGLNASADGSLAARTRELLRRHDLRLKKSLGQSFLINGAKAQRIAEAAVGAHGLEGPHTPEGVSPEAYPAPGGPDSRDTAAAIRPLRVIVEIGPGLGALTVPLAESGRRIVAFEIDERLREPLEGLLAEWPNATVVWQDVLHADLAAAAGGEAYVVAGNLPYQITAPLLEKLFHDPLCRVLVITVQKEVADRLKAGPGSKEYGPLTLFCQYHVRDIETVAQLSPGDFLPPPKIESVALRLVKRTEPPFTEPSAEEFTRTVRAAFAHRRKTLAAGLALALKPGLSREQVAKALWQAEVDGGRRAETLNMGEFARLALALGQVAP